MTVERFGKPLYKSTIGVEVKKLVELLYDPDASFIRCYLCVATYSTTDQRVSFPCDSREEQEGVRIQTPPTTEKETQLYQQIN